jgi:hypothetical protein
MYNILQDHFHQLIQIYNLIILKYVDNVNKHMIQLIFMEKHVILVLLVIVNYAIIKLKIVVEYLEVLWI